jgi:hypothetical protein
VRAAALVSRLRDATALLGVLVATCLARAKQAIVVGHLRDAARLLSATSLARAKQAIVVGLVFWNGVRHTAAWLRFWNGLRKTWFRIVAGLFMTVVIIAAGHWMWGVWHSWQLADSASVTTTWPTNRILDNVVVETKTKCGDSLLYYVVAIVPPKSSGTSTIAERIDIARIETDKLRERLKAIGLQFVDKDGFRTVAFDVVASDFVRIYSSNDERPVFLEARGTRPCSPATYLRAKELILTWTERP